MSIVCIHNFTKEIFFSIYCNFFSPISSMAQIFHRAIKHGKNLISLRDVFDKFDIKI